MTPRGVVTNGIGKRTTAHLNLTRSLADVWRESFASEQPSHPSFVPKSRLPAIGTVHQQTERYHP